ncbi:MAG: hypothetical protein IKO72_04060 [Kiritimatiellae bacterium]|nr:hypothetical protein [Kiritimatiellia bacterium]
MAEVRIRCRVLPAKVERLGGDGAWSKVAVVADGDVVALPGPLACYGVGVWRFWN